MSWTEKKINQTITDIKKRASEDEAFRKLCLDNPTEAVKQISGLEMPEGLKINIIENDPDIDHTIILPSKVEAFNTEELEKITGEKVSDTAKC